MSDTRRGEANANVRFLFCHAFLHAIQLLLQLLVGVDGKAGGGDGELAALMDGFRQIPTDGLGDVVDDFHGALPFDCDSGLFGSI